MTNFNGTPVKFSRHAMDQMVEKKIMAGDVIKAITSPGVTVQVRNRPGQIRKQANGLAVILAPREKNGRVIGWTVVTLYLDQVVTPLRPDQRNDARALASKRLNGH